MKLTVTPNFVLPEPKQESPENKQFKSFGCFFSESEKNLRESTANVAQRPHKETNQVKKFRFLKEEQTCIEGKNSKK